MSDERNGYVKIALSALATAILALFYISYNHQALPFHEGVKVVINDRIDTEIRALDIDGEIGPLEKKLNEIAKAQAVIIANQQHLSKQLERQINSFDRFQQTYGPALEALTRQ